MISHLVVPVEWKAADGVAGTMEGYANVFDVIDLQGHVVKKGAFAETIKRVNSKGIPFLADHDGSVRSVLGTVMQAREDERGLRIKVEFASTQDAQDIRVKMLEGHVRSMSIGWEPIDVVPSMINGKRVLLLKQVKLWEVSAVVFPANTEALITRVKNAAMRELALLEAGGAALTEVNVTVAGFDLAEGKAAIPPHSTRTVDRAWDAGTHVGRISDDAGAATLRRMHALVRDGADPDTKAAYALPHHEVSADGTVGPANLAGVRNALARLPQTEGFSDAERDGAERHLRRHLEDGREESSADTSHLKTGDAESSSPDGEPADVTPRLKVAEMLARADAVLAGRDPDEVADPETLARIEAKLSILPEQIERANRRGSTRQETQDLGD